MIDFLRSVFAEARAYIATHPKLAMCTLAILAAYELNIIQRLWRKAFVYFEVKMSVRLNSRLKRKKTELFEPLFRPGASREGAPLRIVEIGLGGGSNFDFYPDGAEIIGVDPNPEYLKYLHEELKTTAGQKVTMSRVVCAGAETMDRFIDADSVDAVVATLVLCTVQDVQAVVDSCLRVLRPGGVFLFLHHNKADSESQPVRAWLQDFVTPLTFRLGDGCHFNRDPINEIQRAGFASVNSEKFTPPGRTRFAPFSLVYPFLIGSAWK